MTKCEQKGQGMDEAVATDFWEHLFITEVKNKCLINVSDSHTEIQY
jgi:hypothetical protein